MVKTDPQPFLTSEASSVWSTVAANIVAYARVSTTDQNLDAQEDALRTAGAIRIFSDRASGATQNRPEWIKCLEYLQPGNVLLVNDLTRLGRNAADLASIVNSLADRHIGFRSLKEPFLDTTTSHGILIFQMFSAVAEYERNRLRERTMDGLTAARARGRVGGRPVKMTDHKINTARKLRGEGLKIREVAETLGVSESSVVRALSSQTQLAREQS